MSIHSPDQHAFKRAAQALSKLPGASSLNACQTALAQASGHRDLHHLQALQAKTPHLTEASVVTQANIVSRLHRTSSLRIGDILDALTRTRFFGGSPDPEITLTVREALFATDYPDRGRHDIGAPCRVKAPGYDNARALLVERGEGPEGLTRVMIDHSIMTCVSREAPTHRAERLFVPLRFWMPYGFWTEADGTKVLFSRDYCPLWRVQEGRAPVRDDPDRDVKFVKQEWYFDEGSFRGTVDTVMSRGFEILREHRVVSLPRLAEWFPECLATGRWISDLKRWPGGPEMVRAG